MATRCCVTSMRNSGYVRIGHMLCGLCWSTTITLSPSGSRAWIKFAVRSVSGKIQEPCPAQLAFEHSTGRPRDRQTDMAMTTLTARYLITDIGSIEFPVITLSSDGTITDISSDPRALADERDTLTSAFFDIPHTRRDGP